MIAILLLLLSGSIAVGAEGRLVRGLGARPPTTEERAYVEARRVEVRTVEPNDLARTRSLEEEARRPAAAAVSPASRPAAVDNSALRYFPPIGHQGYQNSCVAWAAGYYYNTYTQAMDAGISASDGHPTNLCSPAFLYPLINDGMDRGAYLDYGMARLSVVGCSSLSLALYHEADYTTWPSEAAWVEALSRRTENLYRLQTATADGVEALKQLLANGRLAVAQIDVYGNLYHTYPDATIGIDSEVLYAAGGRYIFGHALTLVGYDDNKEYRDHRDGHVYRGAFLAANSWGASWGVQNTAGHRGFVWIAYRAFLGDRSLIYGTLFTDDRPRYRPTVYALVGVSHAQRGYLTLQGAAGHPTAPQAVLEPVLHNSGGTTLGLDSSRRIAVDLTELAEHLPADRTADLLVSLQVSARASSAGAIAHAEFFADRNGDGSYDAFAAPGLPITVAAGSTGYGHLARFSDLAWNHWAYDEVEVCVAAGIIQGYPDGAYRPDTAVTRDQMAVYIARALAGGEAGVPQVPSTEPPFADIPCDHWAAPYIAYAAGAGVVQGYPEGDYRPDEVVTRGQMAVYMARAMVAPAGEDGLDDYAPAAPRDFPDVPTDYWAYRHVEYCVEAGIVQGYLDGLYRPSGQVLRDQMAVYVARAFGLLPSSGPTTLSPPSVSPIQR